MISFCLGATSFEAGGKFLLQMILSLFAFEEFLKTKGHDSTKVCDDETNNTDAILAQFSTVLFYFSLFALWHTVLKVMIPGLPKKCNRFKSLSEIAKDGWKKKNVFEEKAKVIDKEIRYKWIKVNVRGKGNQLSTCVTR